jgi:hypothetical protein
LIGSARGLDCHAAPYFLHFNSKDQLLAEVLEHVRPAFAVDCKAWSNALAAGPR